MAIYQLIYGDDEQVVRETYADIDDVQREGGWVVLFRGTDAIARLREEHVQSLHRLDGSVVDDLLERNATFARTGFAALSINPSRRLVVIGCVDPRVEPASVLGIGPGEAGVIRNVGGRVTPATMRTMGMLAKVGAANGGAPEPGWHLVVLHHTDCGMTDLAAFPELLAEYFETTTEGLADKAVSDPYASVRVDADLLRRTPPVNSAFAVTGLVYDVQTGLVETVAPTQLPDTTGGVR